MATKTYRWDTPYEWLSEAAREWTPERLYQELCTLALKHDSDTLQDEYQNEMQEDGYFKKQKECRR
jgi:hypothetical protein